MGRPRKVLTPAEREARKKKWWGDDFNQKRREKYASNKEFREGEKRRMRVRSREGGPDYDPRTRLGELDSLATSRDVFDDTGEQITTPCFTTEEVADLLGRQTQALYRWRSAGKFPHGVWRTKAETGNFKQVYTVSETKAILKVFGEHFAETPYYHESHKVTRDRLFAEVEAAAWR